MSEIDVDFLPPEWSARRARRRSTVTRCVTGVATLTSLLAAQGFVIHSSHAVDRELAIVEEQHESARERIEKVEELDHRKQQLEERLALLKDVLKRARGAPLLSAVGHAAPSAITLSEFKLSVLENTEPPVIELSIHGTCPSHDDATSFADRLRSEKLFASAGLVYTMDGTSGAKEFLITALAPGLLRAWPAGAEAK